MHLSISRVAFSSRCTPLTRSRRPPLVGGQPARAARNTCPEAPKWEAGSNCSGVQTKSGTRDQARTRRPAASWARPAEGAPGLIHTGSPHRRRRPRGGAVDGTTTCHASHSGTHKASQADSAREARRHASCASSRQASKTSSTPEAKPPRPQHADHSTPPAGNESRPTMGRGNEAKCQREGKTPALARLQ